MIGTSSGLRLGDRLGDAESCFSSSTVNAPRIGLSSKLLAEFEPPDVGFADETVSNPLKLVFVAGEVVSDETNQFERLALTAISCGFTGCAAALDFRAFHWEIFSTGGLSTSSEFTLAKDFTELDSIDAVKTASDQIS
nr:hypothetical protein Ahy_B06g081265 isoform C [Ipomoea batatas]